MASFSEKDLLSIAKSPGAQYLLVDAEKTLQRFDTGFADIVTKQPVNTSTTFHAYSTTKTFTAAAVMQLVEQGKLALDEFVNPLLPQFSFSEKFTLRQLLSHQSGIANPLPIGWIHSADDKNFDEKKFAQELISKNTKLQFAPGSKMRYTNVGYLVLGCLLEKISGMDYQTFVSENILKRCVQNGYISFSIPPANHATGYHPKFSFTNLLLTFLLDTNKYMQSATGNWSAFKHNQVNGSSYGGLIANATGLSEYLQALLQHQIVTESSLGELFTLQKDNMCLSWYKGKLGKHDYYCHAGGGGGFYCEIRVYPQLETRSVLMTNRSGFSDQRFLDKIDRHFISWN